VLAYTYAGWAYTLTPAVPPAPDRDVVFGSRAVRQYGWYYFGLAALILAIVLAVWLWGPWQGVGLGLLGVVVYAVALATVAYLNMLGLLRVGLEEVAGIDPAVWADQFWRAAGIDWDHMVDWQALGLPRPSDYWRDLWEPELPHPAPAPAPAPAPVPEWPWGGEWPGGGVSA